MEFRYKNFYKCGSIRSSNYFHHLNENNIKIQKDKFDICLISESVLVKFSNG